MSLPGKVDVLVVGGGPAGSTAAGQLAQLGYDVVLIDKQQHPRETVGESILPSAWKYFDLLGVTPAVEQCGFVRKAGGVEYYNDSKATNVDATRKALEAFSGNVIVILGGKDKGSDYRALSPLLRQRARLVLLIGAAAEKIASQIEGAVALEFAGTLHRAVEIAAERARPGDTVLLAPACASYDQFDNFEHRGRVFRERVMALPAAAPDGAASKS